MSAGLKHFYTDDDGNDHDITKLTEAERIELEFLRYFYDAAGDVFGPADDDVYMAIQENYDGILPEGYSYDEEE